MHLRKLNKRGNAPQTFSAGPIAVLVFLIALFMAIYVLLIPQEDRDALLNQTSDDLKGIERSGESLYLLEPKNPGEIKPFASDIEIHDIDSVNVFIRDEPDVSLLSNSLSISKSSFSENPKKLNFGSEDLDLLNKVTLFFNVEKQEGSLIILVNGVEMFNEVATGQQSITIPLTILDKLNAIEFKVSSPGAAIWSSNDYKLSDIRLKQNIELKNPIESRTFILTETESKEDAKLNFDVFCNNPSKSRGNRLTVIINGNQLEQEIMDCASSGKRLEINHEDLKQGKNILTFEIVKGDFLINNIELETKVKEGGAIKYDFSVVSEDFDDILSDVVEAELRLDFTDDIKKKATIDINGNKFTLETDETSFSRTVSSFIKEGNNFLRITPLNEFEIDNLEIRLVE